MKKITRAKKTNSKIYKGPLNSKGKSCYVPIVYNNVKSLKAFIDGAHNISSLVGIDTIPWSLFLSSERFNDVTIKDKKLSKMTKRERVDYVKEIILDELEQDTNIECSEEILSDYYFSASCLCGNFLAFNDATELPKKDLNCDICGRTVIHYTGTNDESYIYDGAPVDIEPYIEEAERELGIEPDNLEEEDE